MDIILELITEHIFEILCGAGVVTATILNKTKTAEQLEKKRQKVIERKKAKFQKLIAKAKKENDKIEKLKEEVKNDCSID